jgi:hypothetical protein
MKLSDFILLGVDEKKRAVLELGVLIGKRIHGGSMIFLFQMSSYYVETYWNLENKDLQEFLAFDSLVPLTPYLETIRINGLPD